MATAVLEREAPVILPAMEIQVVNLRVHGLSELISHRWSDKAKQMMLDKQTKKASTGKKAKDPEDDYWESLYDFPTGKRGRPGGDYGFPSIAFKAAAVRAGTYSELKMTFLRGAFHVTGEYVKIEGDPVMREDMVRLQSGVADIRYRGGFPEWGATLPIKVNLRAIGLEQLLNLFRIAGFSVGVGEWRPEKDGSYGMFEVAK
jgi:hypothetical protein